MNRGDKPMKLLPRLRFPEFRDSGDWKTRPLGELLKEKPQYGVNAGAVPFSEDLPAYVRITDINDDGALQGDDRVSVDIEAQPDNYLQDGDIVLARTGASVGKSYRYRTEDGRLVFAGFLIRVRPNPARLNSEFLSGFLTSWQYWDWVRLTSARGGQPGINGGEYANLPVPIPPVQAEQRKIAECLGSLNDWIAAETDALAALRRHKIGLMQQLFPRPGETRPRLRFPEFQDAGAWEEKPLASLLEETKRPIDMNDDQLYNLVTVKRRYGGVIFREQLPGKRIKVKSQFIVEPDDFLISKRQAVHDACGVVPAELAGSIVSNEYSVLTARPGCNIRFIEYFSRQPALSESFLECSVGIVIEKMLFKLDWWLKLKFPTPDPAEQRRIADCLASLDTSIVARAKKLTALRRHKHGLMQQLFPSADKLTGQPHD